MADPVVAPIVAPAQSTPSPDPAPAPGAAPTPTELGAPADPTTLDPAMAPKTELAKPAEPTAAPFDPAKLTLPEGLKPDDPNFKTFTEVFSDEKLPPQERAQKLMDLYTTSMKQVGEAQANAWRQTNDSWVAAVKADPEIGGAKFAEVKTSIARAIDGLGPELSVAFRQGLDATGAGNHPAIWKGLAKMAALLTEGGHVTGNPPSAKPDLASTFFPNSKMEG